MEYLNLPEGYQTVMPYLILKDAQNFIQFTKDVFGAVEMHKTMRDEQVIRHAEVSIGGSVIMLAEQTENFDVQNAGLFIYLDNCDATYQRALTYGATSLMEPSDQSYGRCSGVKDAFGNTWWLTTAFI
jgi:PhnB protein